MCRTGYARWAPPWILLKRNRTVPVEGADPDLLERVGSGVDLITFTSPSTVRSFHELVGGKRPGRAAVIGPVTASTARDLGYPVAVEARPFTVPGLVDAIVDHFEGGLR